MDISQWRTNYASCEDVALFSIGSAANVVHIMYCRTLCDKKYITETVLPLLQRIADAEGRRTDAALSPLQAIEAEMLKDVSGKHLNKLLFSGRMIVWLEQHRTCLAVPVADFPEREVEESSIEVSIRGPKDGLVESIDKNAGLIRRRLPTPSLAYQTYTMGTESQTKVGLMYHKDKLSAKTLQLVQERLKLAQEQTEALNSAIQLEELLRDDRYSMFPETVYTGRSDYVVDCLLSGRFVLLIEGVPGATIAPATLPSLLLTPEDKHFDFYSSSFGRLLRWFSLVLSIYLPGFFVSLTSYHQDQIPFRLLATITVTRLGLPFSVAMEMFIILILMDIFREAGFRLPTPIGHTITVVGGLIIGDAAIRAGLASPTIVVVAAICIVAGATLISQTLSGTVSLLRYVVLTVCSLLGMYGFMLAFIFLIVYLSGLTSFGVPYMMPLAPLRVRDFAQSLFKLPNRNRGKVPDYLSRRGGNRHGK